MDPEISRAAASSTGASGEIELPAEKAAAPSPTPRAAPARGRVLRERGLSRVQTGVSSAGLNDSKSSTPGSGRVLRDRSSRGVVAGKNGGGNFKDQNEFAAANRRRKSEYPRRRRNAGTRVENSGEAGDDGGLAIGSEDKKDPSEKASRSSRPRRPQPQSRQRAPSARSSRPSPTLVCKSEPDTETTYAGAVEDVLERTGGSDEDDDVLIGEEDPPFRDDPNDLNYKPETESEEDVDASSEEDIPFRDDPDDQNFQSDTESYGLLAEPQKPRRRPPRQKEEKKERERDKERGKEIKTEGGAEMDVKLEDEFGEEAEPPRKRGRRRKDDKSPRLPKRRKKPPVQYVRCEMEGCGTVLAHPRYLQHHIKYQHLLKKKYVCPHPSCGRLFRLQKQLLRHAKHHTDQRDYICEYCARAFKSSHNLAVHRMIHTGEKPLQCEICGFTCRQKASLNWHMKKHDADAFYQFSCNICGKKFEKKDSVVAHKAKSHPEVLIAEALAANAGALITTPAPLLEALPSTGQAEHMVVVSEEQSLPPMQVTLPLALPLATQQIITTHPQQTQLLQLAPPPPQQQQPPQLIQLTPLPQTPAQLLPQAQDLVNSRESLVLGPMSALCSSPPPPSVLHQSVMQPGDGGGVWEGEVEAERHRVEEGVVWVQEADGDGERGDVPTDPVRLQFSLFCFFPEATKRFMAGELQSGRPGSGRSRTGKAVALARLLHRDCTRLLELYVSDINHDRYHCNERVWLLHSALKQCLGLLEYVIGREEELEGEGDGEYESVRNSVRDRLGHLLHTTRVLLEKEEEAEMPAHDPDCNKDVEVDEGDGVFGVKLWIYRVLQELIHWTHSASEALHTFHSEREASKLERGGSESDGAEI
ncbi:hypothetical protein SKAU_G00039180 [Synaphobranchus kaupii]|uniref:E3 ubiquitin-protein ligase ZFP91 n=1 Tax=Synaphobranchus kaupii TaxID=118154 RepID=A0A9Q1GH23_SYNKA|nr:hypothetical protein SKAU_G00039180 [Synaphobranchus kaupii]